MPQAGRKLLESVWDEAAPALARVACAIGLDGDRVDDVLQDVFLTAWKKCPNSVDRGELRRWLFRVTINRCNLEHRRRANWRKVLNGLARSWTNRRNVRDPADNAAQTEEQNLIRRCLDTLEPQLRSVLVLRYFAEFNSREIGKILKQSDSTVRSQLRTARRQLAQELRRAGYSHE